MKKVVFILIYTILIFTLFFIMIESIYSINIGFTTDSVTENEFDSIIKSKKVELLNEDPKGGAIECFAVSENGLIALGFAPVEDSKKFVGVYNSNFEFLYAYAFNDSGSFGIAWDNENLVICSVRGNDLVSVSPHGEITEIAKIQDTIDNSRHWREKIEATEQTIQGVTYKIQNVGLTSFYEGSYSQLVKINENNEIQVLYNSSSIQTTKFVIIFVAIFLIVLPSIAFYIVVTIKKRKQQLKA